MTIGGKTGISAVGGSKIISLKSTGFGSLVLEKFMDGISIYSVINTLVALKAFPTTTEVAPAV